METVCY